MTARAKKEAPAGLTIPMALIGVIVSLAVTGIGGLIWMNVQIALMNEQAKITKEQSAEMKGRIDFLYQIEMQRYPRAGPPASEGRGQ